MSAKPEITRTVIQLRKGQRRFVRMVDERRLAAFCARRQYGKTTLFSTIALKKMMKRKNHTVIFGSAKINLAREIVRKEAGVMQAAIASLREEASDKNRLQVADSISGTVPDKLNADDFASMFEAQRLEFRYYHSNSTYSRTKVVALLPDTVGETGDLMMDEIGRVRNFREVWEAVEPIISSDPTFRCLLCTTPPPDDTHFSFEMLAPPPGSNFPINPEGNIYRSEMGVYVLRVDAFDAYADGVPVYDSDEGKPLSPTEHRKLAHDKDAWDRNYGVKFVVGGTAACDLLRLSVAQERGVGKCQCFQIESDQDMADAILWVSKNLSPIAQIGLGFDVATTTKDTSNPSCISFMEKEGPEFLNRALLLWKTRDPDVAIERLGQAIRVVENRKAGRARALSVDATNEKYFAEMVRKAFRAMLPVELVVASEAVDKPGLDKPTNFKQYLGSQYVGILEDNHLTLPPQAYVKLDHRLVRKDRGLFVCEPSPEGWHGETFDANKLAVHSLVGISEATRFIPATGRRAEVISNRRSREVIA